MPIYQGAAPNQLFVIMGTGDIGFGLAMPAVRNAALIGFYQVEPGPIGRETVNDKHISDSATVIGFTNLESMDYFIDYLKRSREYFAAHIAIRESLDVAGASALDPVLSQESP